MDMGHMHDMGIGSDVNHAFAHDYLYIGAATVAAFAVANAVNMFSARSRFVLPAQLPYLI